MEFMLQEGRGVAGPGECAGEVFFRPDGARLFLRFYTHGLRRGPHSFRFAAIFLGFAVRGRAQGFQGNITSSAGACALGYWFGGEGETDGEFCAAFGLVAAGNLSTVILDHAIDGA